MKARVKIAIALVATAFMLWLGAVGNAEFYGDFSTSDCIRIGIGLILAAVAFPLGGGELTDCKEDDDGET